MRARLVRRDLTEARPILIGACAALALVVSGIAAGQGQAVAAPAHEDESSAVVASGEAPMVSPAVTQVQAPYPLPTSTPSGEVRARVITLAQSQQGIVWTANAPSAGNCTPSGLPAAAGLNPSTVKVLDCMSEAFPQVGTYYGVGQRAMNSRSDHPRGLAVDAMIDGWDTPEGNALGWEVANYVADNSAALNVKYVIFDAQIYIPGSGWRAYRHPSGANDPNNAHLNHVHVSVRS